MTSISSEFGSTLNCAGLRNVLWLTWMVLVCTAPSARAADDAARRGANTFRWVHPNSDAQLWQQIESVFRDELAPDEGKEGQDELDVYRYKYLEKVGILNHSVLVIVGHRPARELSKKNTWDEYFTAFNFDSVTGQKSQIEHAEWMWSWKFLKLAKFGPGSIPDVTFTYQTCKECEPETMLASLYFDEAKFAWKIRSWGDGRDIWWTASDGLIVDMDVNDGGDTISFDCAYGIRDVNGDGFQDVAIRCKQITYTAKGRTITQDSTVLYSLVQGQFKSRRIADESEILALTTKSCRPDSPSWLCKLPGYMTVTSGQNDALEQMFPHAPKTSRELSCFHGLKRSTTMLEVVGRCGVPNELGGSGVNIFIYHLDDGSIVAIGATGVENPLLYANHASHSGKSSDLLTGN